MSKTGKPKNVRRVGRTLGAAARFGTKQDRTPEEIEAGNISAVRAQINRDKELLIPMLTEFGGTALEERRLDCIIASFATLETKNSKNNKVMMPIKPENIVKILVETDCLADYKVEPKDVTKVLEDVLKGVRIAEKDIPKLTEQYNQLALERKATHESLTKPVVEVKTAPTTPVVSPTVSPPESPTTQAPQTFFGMMSNLFSPPSPKAPGVTVEPVVPPVVPPVVTAVPVAKKTAPVVQAEAPEGSLSGEAKLKALEEKTMEAARTMTAAAMESASDTNVTKKAIDALSTQAGVFKKKDPKSKGWFG
jgi:hypothetical protein